MRRLQAAVASGDRGAYAILYAVLMVVLLAMGALVLDVAGVRADRRAAKAASDAGAVAGASALGITSPDPRAACSDSVRFAAATLGTTVDATTLSTGCSVFPASAVCTPATATILATVQTADEWVIEVHWPVGNDSGLMQPSLEKWTDPPVTQLASDVDGSPCSRVGSRVHRTRPLVLGSGLGLGTDVARRAQDSVALAEIRPGEGNLVAPLVVLDPHSCNALNATGDGGVVVTANGTTPGVIAVDSDGTGGDIGCDGGKKTITVTNNSQIHATDSTSGAKALILSYALPDHFSTAYDPTKTADGCQPTPGTFTTVLCPRPSPQGARVTRAPFDYRYNCVAICPPGSDYVDQFKRYLGFDLVNGTYTPGPAMAATAVNACSSVAASYSGETYLTCASGSQTVTVSGTTVIDGGGGKVRIDAKILNVTGTLVLRNAQVNLNVDRLDVNGCIIVNPPDTGPAETYAQTCDVNTALHSPTGYATSSDMPPMWVRGEIKVGGSFVARQTFVLQPRKADPLNGRLNISTGGRVYWSAPFGDDAVPVASCVPGSGSTPPSVGCFEDLALWNEWDGPVNNPDVLNGQSKLLVDGTFFAPASGFTFGGGVDQDQTRAQFVAKRLNLNGQGVLTLTPDADRATLIPFVVGALIR